MWIRIFIIVVEFMKCENSYRKCILNWYQLDKWFVIWSKGDYDKEIMLEWMICKFRLRVEMLFFGGQEWGDKGLSDGLKHLSYYINTIVMSVCLCVYLCDCVCICVFVCVFVCPVLSSERKKLLTCALRRKSNKLRGKI